MTPREELLQIQKVISNNIKDQIRSYQGKPSRHFRKYLKEYSREFKTYKDIIDKANLIKKILKSDVGKKNQVGYSFLSNSRDRLFLGSPQSVPTSPGCKRDTKIELRFVGTKITRLPSSVVELINSATSSSRLFALVNMVIL